LGPGIPFEPDGQKPIALGHDMETFDAVRRRSEKGRADRGLRADEKSDEDETEQRGVLHVVCYGDAMRSVAKFTNVSPELIARTGKGGWRSRGGTTRRSLLRKRTGTTQRLRKNPHVARQHR